MPYDPRAIANEFLKLAQCENKPLNPMKIQKLLYFAHGWNLALNNKPLFDRPIQAWKYGPVIPDVYQAFRRFGSGTITEPAFKSIMRSGRLGITPYSLPADDECPERKDADSIVQRVWRTYKKYSAIDLSEMTHRDGGAWEKAWRRERGQSFIDMRDDEIEMEFREKTERARTTS